MIGKTPFPSSIAFELCKRHFQSSFDYLNDKYMKTAFKKNVCMCTVHKLNNYCFTYIEFGVNRKTFFLGT